MGSIIILSTQPITSSVSGHTHSELKRKGVTSMCGEWVTPSYK